MNKVILMGRLTRDPEVRYGGASNTAIARFGIAVNRRFRRDGQPEADFFNCTAFGRNGEFVEKYLRKGTKIVLDGEVQNDNYQDKNGNMVRGTQIIVNSVEFAESKAAAANNAGGGYYDGGAGGGFSGRGGTSGGASGGFMEIDGNGSGDSMRDPDGFMALDDDDSDDGIPFA